MSEKTIIGLSYLTALQRRVDTIARNIANQSTTAFKAEGVKFSERLAEHEADDPGSSPPKLVTASRFTDFSPGPLKPTGSSTDAAIVGDGFFVVEKDGSERYTRRGSFAIDAGGRLVTSAGELVLTSTGPIRVNPSDGQVNVGADGTVSTAKGVIGRLRLVRFDDLRQLEAESGGLFRSAQRPIELPVGEIRLVAGALEGSNVNTVREMSKLIEASRTYESVAKTVMKKDEQNELRRLAGLD